MKTSVLIIVIFITICFYAFLKDKNPYPALLKIKDIDKSVAKIGDSLYAGKYEVSNQLYLTFEKSLIDSKKKDLLNIIKVDSLNWLEKTCYNQPYVEYYYRHPSYGNYPVVNISFEAANLFCKWLTDEYNAAPKRAFKKVLFRLPTEQEWEKAARGKMEYFLYAWGDRLIGEKGKMCNYYRIGDECIKYDTINKKYYFDYKGKVGYLNEVGFITTPVSLYTPNGYGLYNVCGNVAEMISIKGISCGGSWKSPGGDVTVLSRANYTGTANDLGFRYFMVVLEK